MLPDFLVDRSIGRRVVDLLREEGLTIHTLADVFGEERAQAMFDPEWIMHAGKHGMLALTKDKHIRHRTIERDSVAAAHVHLFALAAGNLGFQATADAFIAAAPRMQAEAATVQGGVIWVVHRDGNIFRQWP
ncbi:hypothetical protein [Actinoplanes sp. NPDC026619]|uniref:PIN-like domain-containing protein n=1 Tax=Actinoplanes sp. NPDC026619 TaxID=3155798 RepID=UPI0034054420